MTLQEKIREWAREINNTTNEEIAGEIFMTDTERTMFVAGCEYAYAQVVKLLKENNIDREI